MTTFDFSAVPADLRELNQWVIWRYEDVTNKKKETKRTKVPYNAKSGSKASSTNHKTWCDFETARAALERGVCDGIGFVVTSACSIVGIDLDHCFDATSGEIAEWALPIVEAMDTYTEITPSGEGLRLFARGTLPEAGRKKGDFEIYNSGRFLTITGNHFKASPLEIHERGAQIHDIHERIFGAPKTEIQSTLLSNLTPFSGTDSELLNAIFESKNGAAIRELWHGNWQAHYSSHSEADSALCFHLAFWTARDALRMDALFRQSGLMRTKWDEIHFGSQETYGQHTIAEACKLVSQSFSESKGVVLRSAGTRAWIQGANLEIAETKDAAEKDDDDEVTSDADEEARKTGLYAMQWGRTFLLINKSKDLEAGSETNTKKLPVWDGAAHIVSELTDEDGAAIYEIKGKTRLRRNFSVEIPAAKMTDPKHMAGAMKNGAGAGCVFYAGMEKHLAPSIDSFTSWQNLQYFRRFNRVGWTNDGKEFIIPGLMGADASIQLDRKLAYAITTDNIEAGQEALYYLLKAQRSEITALALSSALFAPMARPAGLLDERWITFMTGRTNSFKTEWTKLLMCFYGAEFQNEDILLKWGLGASKKSLTDYLTRAADMPFLIDNYKPNTGGGEKELVEIIHMIIEGGGRETLTRASTQRGSRPIHCTPFFTGEDSPHSDAASAARMLVLPFIWDADEENTHLTEAQSRAYLLNAMGGAWLRWLASDEGKAIARQSAAMFAELRSKWAKHLRTVRRDTVGLFRVASNLAGNEIAWRVALQCPALEPVLKLFVEHHGRGLIEIAGNMANYTAQSFEATRYLDALRALIASGQAGLVSLHTSASLPERVTKLGWEDDRGAYLIPDIAYKAASGLLSESGGLNNVSKITIHRQLVQIGALARTGKAEQTYSKTINGRSERILHLKPEILNGADEREDDEQDSLF
jgi:primase-polymerase (primpol)-like protein